MNSTNNYLSALVGTSADAMTNLYKVEITDALASAPLLQSMSVRLKNFTPPAFQRATTAIHYQTINIDEPTADYVGNRQFQLVFRLDENFELYQYLLARKGRVSDPSTGYAGTSINAGMTVVVKALATDPTIFTEDPDTYKKLWKYEYCWVQDVKLSPFSYQSSQPMTVTATINFWKWQDPIDLGDL